MNKTLKRLFDGIAAIKPENIEEPKDKLGEGEVVIGQITDRELKKFFIFKNHVADSLRDMVKKHNKMKSDEIGHNPLTCPKCQDEARLKSEHDFYEAVKDLFWTAVKDTLSSRNKVRLSGGSGIGLRSGWQIVITPRPSVSKLLTDLAMLFGSTLNCQPNTAGPPNWELGCFNAFK